MAFDDHFSAQSRQYAAFRPTYPPELAGFLAGLAPAKELAWDAATGQGQAARLLAAEFRRVLATDASAAQIANAEPCARVEFRVGDATQSGLADYSCDLVTVAQAAHWFDLERFYREVRRVLKPRGVLAIWGYVLLQTGNAGIDRCLETFQDVAVGPCWPPGPRDSPGALRDAAVSLRARGRAAVRHARPLDARRFDRIRQFVVCCRAISTAARRRPDAGLRSGAESALAGGRDVRHRVAAVSSGRAGMSRT